MSELKPSLGNFCTAFVLSVAWSLGTAAAVIVALTAYDEFTRHRARSSAQSPSVPVEELTITASGTPLIQVGGARNPIDTLAADRTPVAGEKREPILPAVRLRPWGANAERYLRRDRQLDRQRVHSIPVSETGSRWYFVVEDVDTGRGQFIGYDSTTCLPTGYVGRSGFRDEPVSDEEQFRVAPRLFLDWTRSGFISQQESQALFADQDDARLGFLGEHPLTKTQIAFQSIASAYLIDFERSSVDELLPGMEILSLGTTGRVIKASAVGPEQELELRPNYLLELSLAALTPESVIFVHPIRKTTFEYRLPEALIEQGFTISLFQASDDSLIALAPIEDSFRESRPGTGEYQIEYARIAPNGEILERRVIDLQTPTAGPLENYATAMNVATLSIPGTLPSSIIGGYLLPLLHGHEPGSFLMRARRLLGITWPAILIATLISAGMCRLVIRRQDEYRLPRSYAWVAFVFLLGIPGYLGYRFHRKWPVKTRPTRPVRTGSEVFAA